MAKMFSKWVYLKGIARASPAEQRFSWPQLKTLLVPQRRCHSVPATKAVLVASFGAQIMAEHGENVEDFNFFEKESQIFNQGSAEICTEPQAD